MKLHALPKITTTGKKRLGQGYGSGRGGHTSSRGQKGQKSRGSVRLSFTGSSWVWFKRLPFIRGKSRFNQLHSKVTLTLDDLAVYASGSVVDIKSLREHHLIPNLSGSKIQPKIVATGKITKKLSVRVPATKTAIKLIEAAGGDYSVQTE